MSTAGKVLVVLVTLSLMAWIVLFSAVAQFNTNWGMKLAKQDKDIEKLRADLDAAVTKVSKNQVATSAIQAKAQKDMIVLRGSLADAEKVLSESIETNSRYQIDLQTVEAHAKAAQAALDRREREKVEATRQLADIRAVVKQFQGENDALLGRFSKLQKDFLDTMAANRKLAKEAAKGSIRSASFRP